MLHFIILTAIAYRVYCCFYSCTSNIRRTIFELHADPLWPRRSRVENHWNRTSSYCATLLSPAGVLQAGFYVLLSAATFNVFLSLLFSLHITSAGTFAEIRFLLIVLPSSFLSLQDCAQLCFTLVKNRLCIQKSRN